MYFIGETINLKKNDKQIMARSEKSHVFGSRLLSANENARTKMQYNQEVSKEVLSKLIWKDIKIPLKDKRVAHSLH